MKLLDEKTIGPFLEEINELCRKYQVCITAHCTWVGYGKNGDAAHCISNAVSHKVSEAKAKELVEWYGDGKFREHIRQ